MRSNLKLKTTGFQISVPNQYFDDFWIEYRLWRTYTGLDDLLDYTLNLNKKVTVSMVFIFFIHPSRESE